MDTPSNIILNVSQYPGCGTRQVRYTGDILRIKLNLSSSCAGKAWLRTNLGSASVHRSEIIHHFDSNAAVMGRDWTDLPMRQEDSRTYEISLPLNEVGSFEFKAFFIPEGSEQSYWACNGNGNGIIKVEPAKYYASNTIYNAFVRQFGRNLSHDELTGSTREACAMLDKEGFTVIPPSGKFREFGQHLDFILGELGFRIIQFLPIHPTPTTFARMGRYGSAFAPLDFFSVDAGMADFDRRTTPLQQFCELVDKIHARGGLVFIDIPINHTGWASTMQNHHPEWFLHNQDGSFASPGAWGTVWEDLCSLDFTSLELKHYLVKIFLHWCENGVDGFRCDAGYMIPSEIWTYIICSVRSEYPDTIFFLEGLGGGQDATTRRLNESGMDWAYSELFQNYDNRQIAGYTEFSSRYSSEYGALVNFAETHDNERLALKGSRWASMRIALAALFSPAGCFGMANGVEWLATQKIDVHGASSLNWGAKDNLVGLLQKLLRLLSIHPAFHGNASLRPPVGSSGDANGLLRIPRKHPEQAVLAIVNPQLNAAGNYSWNIHDFSPDGAPVDLLSGRRIPVKVHQCQASILLQPGEFLCLALSKEQAEPIRKMLQYPSDALQPTAVEQQQLRATVLDFMVARNGFHDLGAIDLASYAAALYHNPLGLLSKINGDNQYLPVVEWYPNKDERRIVPLPPRHHLLINHSQRFVAQIRHNGKCLQRIDALPREDGRFFVLFQPLRNFSQDTAVTLHLSVFSDAGDVTRINAPLLQLTSLDNQQLLYHLKQQSITSQHCALATTDLGGYGLIRAAWGHLDSQYDALLAANLHAETPVERTIVFPRCRIEIEYHGFTHELGLECQRDFSQTGPNAFQWRFIVPTGMGGNTHICINYLLDKHSNHVTIRLVRCAMPNELDELNGLDANSPITVTLRPDIDDRSHHTNTAAYPDAEKQFPGRLHTLGDGFAFDLGTGRHRLEIRSEHAGYTPSPCWQYNVFHRIESERGLHDHGDLFSPGYFRARLQRNQSLTLEAQVIDLSAGASSSQPQAAFSAPVPGYQGEPALDLSLSQALDLAMEAYIVHRGKYGSIIAGYPWFLDWGRDTLTCLRGLIAAGRQEQAIATIRQFASFEENGTLPNMINGEEVFNRDTTDAPLMLFVAVHDAISKYGKAEELLQLPCGSRTLLAILESIASHYLGGTPNGICVDKSSGLVFSPAHFTWMDTNYPAATPREGYPVEIQAMWHLALTMLWQYTGKTQYKELFQQVEASFSRLYPSGKFVGLSDCLHATRGQTAFEAKADDAARPNQLWAINLGLVKEPGLQRHILQACSALIVPGAMRTLADQPVSYPQPVSIDGRNLNDALHPYWGSYSGDENTRRKPAYHNGTAWGLLLPQYCEALFRTYGKAAREGAAALLGTAASSMRQCCIGQLPEIVDGSFPHIARGCCAQAWSVTEFRRVLELLRQQPES